MIAPVTSPFSPSKATAPLRAASADSAALLPHDTLVRSTAATARPAASDLKSLTSPNQASATSQESASSGATLAPTALKKWTVLVYAAADNNLYPFELQNMLDIEKVGSTADFNVVTQFDGCEGAARRLMLKCESPDGSIGSPVVKSLGAVNMSDPKTLANFIEWGMKHYPAEHTMLIINDHGGGWEGCVQDRSGEGWMTLPDLHKGLDLAQAKTGKKLDVLGFDACLMGMAEVAHELKDDASYMVASQETEGVAGWPYSNILTSDLLHHVDNMLRSRLPLEPADVAKAAVAKSAGLPEDLPTMAAFDMSKEPVLKATVEALAQAITASGMSQGVLSSVAGQTQEFSGFKDLYDFCSRLDAEPSATTDVKSAAHAVMGSVKEMVIAEQHNGKYPDAHGVSIELRDGRESYENLAFAQDTSWQAALKTIGFAGRREGARPQAG